MTNSFLNNLISSLFSVDLTLNVTNVQSLKTQLIKSQSPLLKPCLGKNPAEEKAIGESVDSLLKLNLDENRANVLQDLNKALSAKTFFSTNYLSLSDIVLFSLLYNVPFRFSERLTFVHVLRYYDLIQHQVAELVKQTGNALELRVDSFDLEVPFVPTPAVEKESKDGKDGKKKDKKDNKKDEKAVDKKVEKPTDKKAVEAKQPAIKGPADLLPLVDIRIGTITSVKRHPDADTLYVEEVELGEEKPRTVVSGLVKYLKEEDLLNKQVVLLCNLKAAKMRGVESQAMVLAATGPSVEGAEGKLELLVPPAGSQNGDLVSFEGYDRKPEAVLNSKKKVWESIQPQLAIGEGKTAVYITPDDKKHIRLVATKGAVTVPSLTTASIK